MCVCLQLCVCVWESFTFVAGLTSAPWLRRTSATLTLSSWAARWSGVSPLCIYGKDTHKHMSTHKYICCGGRSEQASANQMLEISMKRLICFSSIPYCTHWRWRSWPAAVTPGPRCPPALPGEWGQCLAASPRWCRRRTPAVWSQCPFGSFWQRCGAACSHSEAGERHAGVKRRRWALLLLPPAPLALYCWSNISSIIWYLVFLFGIFITSTL